MSDGEKLLEVTLKRREFITTSRKILFLTSGVLLTVLICRLISNIYSSTIVASPKRPIVNTDCGLVEGIEDFASGVSIFKGIPYAVPPAGNLRWKPPVGLKAGKKCWKGVLKADKFSNCCAQLQHDNTVTGSEDCLYLNVLTRVPKKGVRMPVVVWIHGGSLIVGSGSDKYYSGYYPNGQFVHDMGTVAVSINYRLNAFGFMALDVLSEASPTKTSGNYGFMDQILALKWVQKNIENFGGDETRVTVLGQSSGGTSIFGLLASEAAQGLFQNVISMSGSPVFNKTTKDASKDNLIFVKNSNCSRNRSEEILRCLYDLSISEVLHAIPWTVFPYWAMKDIPDLPTYNHFDGALAVVDGDVVKFPPGELHLHPFNRTDKVTIVIGFTAQEIGIRPVHNFTYSSYEDFVSFAVERLTPFIGHDDALLGVNMYSEMRQPRGSRAEYIYETLGSDVRVICPSNFLAANFSKSRRHTVYRYLSTAIPSHPIYFLGHAVQYAFHVLDTLAFFGFHNLPRGYVPQPTDLSFTRILRRELGHVIYYGHPEWPYWTPYPMSTAVISNDCLDLSPPGGYHDKQCRFWLDRGFFSYAWIN